MMQALLLAAACCTAPAGAWAAADAPAAERPPARLHVEVAHTRESLTGGRGEWTESRVRLARERSGRSRTFVEARVLTRSERRDGDLGLGAVLPLGPHWTVGLEAGSAPNRVFLPRWRVGASIAHAVGGGWVPGYGLRYRDYPGGGVVSQHAELDYYRGPYMVGYSLNHFSVHGAGTGLAHIGRVSRAYGAQSSVGVTVAGGYTVETLPDEVELLQVYSLALWGTHWVGERTALTWLGGWGSYGTLFRRRTLGVGVRQQL